MHRSNGPSAPRSAPLTAASRAYLQRVLDWGRALRDEDCARLRDAKVKEALDTVERCLKTCN